MGFIDGPEDVIELERELLCWIFEQLNRHHWDLLAQYRRTPLPSSAASHFVTWLKAQFGR